MKLGKNIENEPMTMQLAPFIDVILFLLVFFLLTWNIARYEAELSVQLPVAEKAETSTRVKGAELLINVNEAGKIIINGEEIGQRELETFLRDFPDSVVILRADSRTQYQNVINVIDICKGAGVWNIAFITSDPEK